MNHGGDKMLLMGSTTPHRNFHITGLPPSCEHGDSIGQTKRCNGVCSRDQPRVSNSFEVAHTSPHIHHINTPLWIRSHLPTRRPSIALTLILRILEYPLSLVYELCKGSKFPYPRNPAIRIDNDNPAGVYFFTHALATYRPIHIMYLGNLQAEAGRGSRPRPD